MIDKGIPRAHYQVFDKNSTLIGEITSGTQSPSLGKGIGMAYLEKAHTAIGSEVFIEIRGKKLLAKVAKLPFL
jgi:aminomethyltransferase